MLTLRAGSNAIVVAPEHGAGVVGWMAGSIAMLRRAVPGAMTSGDPNVMGWFPLLPYCNRIALRRFVVAGAGAPPGAEFWRPAPFDPWHRLAAPLGRRSRGGEQRGSQLDARGGCRPGRSHSALKSPTRLTSDAVTVAIAVTNLAPASGAGGARAASLYSQGNDAASLCFAAKGVWVNDGDVLPASTRPIPATGSSRHPAQWRRCGSTTASPAGTGTPMSTPAAQACGSKRPRRSAIFRSSRRRGATSSVSNRSATRRTR